MLFKINRNVRLWNMIYNLSAVHVKLLKLKGNTSWKLLPKKGFSKTLKENIQLQML